MSILLCPFGEARVVVCRSRFRDFSLNFRVFSSKFHQNQQISTKNLRPCGQIWWRFEKKKKDENSRNFDEMDTILVHFHRNGHEMDTILFHFHRSGQKMDKKWTREKWTKSNHSIMISLCFLLTWDVGFGNFSSNWFFHNISYLDLFCKRFKS